jgi:hypothetical protein
VSYFHVSLCNGCDYVQSFGKSSSNTPKHRKHLIMEYRHSHITVTHSHCHKLVMRKNRIFILQFLSKVGKQLATANMLLQCHVNTCSEPVFQSSVDSLQHCLVSIVRILSIQRHTESDELTMMPVNEILENVSNVGFALVPVAFPILTNPMENKKMFLI